MLVLELVYVWFDWDGFGCGVICCGIWYVFRLVVVLMVFRKVGVCWVGWLWYVILLLVGCIGVVLVGGYLGFRIWIVENCEVGIKIIFD